MPDYNEETYSRTTPSTLEDMYIEKGCFPQALPTTPVAQRLAKTLGNHMATRFVHVKPHVPNAAPEHYEPRKDDDPTSSTGEHAPPLPKKTSYSAYPLSTIVPVVERLRGQRSHTRYRPGRCFMALRPHLKMYIPMDEPLARFSADSLIHAEDTDISYTPSTLSAMRDQQLRPLQVSSNPQVTIISLRTDYVHSKNALAYWIFHERCVT